MIVPSVDIQGGNAVQLVGGETLAINAGDPIPIAERFGRVGEVAVIDLDAALGTGSNKDIIREIVRRVPCRVGGGIRDAKAAIEWLDAVAGPSAPRDVHGELAAPFVLVMAPKAPHYAATPAPWYERGTWVDNVSAPRTESYGVDPHVLKDHHGLIAGQGPLREHERFWDLIENIELVLRHTAAAPTSARRLCAADARSNKALASPHRAAHVVYQ